MDNAYKRIADINLGEYDATNYRTLSKIHILLLFIWGKQNKEQRGLILSDYTDVWRVILLLLMSDKIYKSEDRCIFNGKSFSKLKDFATVVLNICVAKWEILKKLNSAILDFKVI